MIIVIIGMTIQILFILIAPILNFQLLRKKNRNIEKAL